MLHRVDERPFCIFLHFVVEGLLHGAVLAFRDGADALAGRGGFGIGEGDGGYVQQWIGLQVGWLGKLWRGGGFLSFGLEEAGLLGAGLDEHAELESGDPALQFAVVAEAEEQVEGLGVGVGEVDVVLFVLDVVDALHL